MLQVDDDDEWGITDETEDEESSRYIVGKKSVMCKYLTAV
jgi:hypothetical protein